MTVGPYATGSGEAICAIFILSHVRNAQSNIIMREMHISQSKPSLIVVTQGPIFSSVQRSISTALHNKEQTMMTQPIQMFENLTSETSPAGGNDITKTPLSFEDRRMLELRARYARAEMVADGLADALLWVGRQCKRLVGAIKADFKLRAAESHLLRMSDRELADIGLSRGDIHFALREPAAEGVAPEIAYARGSSMVANENLRRVA